jgi:hypothetical protein
MLFIPSFSLGPWEGPCDPFGGDKSSHFTVIYHFRTGVNLNESSQMHLINDSPRSWLILNRSDKFWGLCGLGESQWCISQSGHPLFPSNLAPFSMLVCLAWLSLIILGGAQGRMGQDWAEGHAGRVQACVCHLAPLRIPRGFGELPFSSQMGLELDGRLPSTRKLPGGRLGG